MDTVPARPKQAYRHHSSSPTSRDHPDNRLSHLPGKDNNRVFKRSRSNRNDPSAQVQMPAGNTRLSEDDLFELLIGRIRQREERAAIVADMQRQMKADNFELKDENQALKEQLGSCHAQLRKKTSESKTYRTQMDNWKAKLRKFKIVVNGLGQDYDFLRDQINSFKTTTKTLGKEKSELLQDISDAKEKISEATNAIEEQNRKLADSEQCIAILRQELRISEEKEKEGKARLSEEKKRASLLESYIQTYAQRQMRQLGMVRVDQCKLKEKLESTLESISGCLSTSQNTILSTLSPVLDECISSVKTLDKSCSEERMDVRKFTSSVDEVASR